MQIKSQRLPGYSLRRSLMIWAVLLAVPVILVPASVRPQSALPPNCLGGTLDAPIRMDVFSDFQCPACRTFYLETVTQVLKSYATNDKICIIYHEFPLAMHPYGREAARYSLAAQRLGRKQWAAVVDALYTKQPIWSLDGKLDAIVMGAVSPEDFAKIKKALQEPSIEQAIAQDIALGQKKEVKSTPTIFVTALNKQQKVEGPLEYPVWKNFFDGIVK